MKDLKRFILDEDGDEIRVSIDQELCDGPFVGLALNHFEDPSEWGAQRISPKTARELASFLLKYADVVESERKHNADA